MTNLGSADPIILSTTAFGVGQVSGIALTILFLMNQKRTSKVINAIAIAVDNASQSDMSQVKHYTAHESFLNLGMEVI